MEQITLSFKKYPASDVSKYQVEAGVAEIKGFDIAKMTHASADKDLRQLISDVVMGDCTMDDCNLIISALVAGVNILRVGGKVTPFAMGKKAFESAHSYAKNEKIKAYLQQWIDEGGLDEAGSGGRTKRDAPKVGDAPIDAGVSFPHVKIGENYTWSGANVTVDLGPYISPENPWGFKWPDGGTIDNRPRHLVAGTRQASDTKVKVEYLADRIIITPTKP